MTAIPINFGRAEIQRLKDKKVVYLFGITAEWVQQCFVRRPDLGRVLTFTLLSFTTAPPEIESPLFQNSPPQFLDYYNVREFFVDPLVNISDYYRLLENISDTLEEQGFTVLKVLKEPKTFKPAFAENIGLEMFLERPVFVDSFIEKIEDNYYPLDSTPESLFTSSWRFRYD